MRKLSDEEKAKLQTEIEKSQEKRKTYHIAEQAEKEKSATIMIIAIVTLIFAILGGIVPVLWLRADPSRSEWGLGYLLVIPFTAIAGAIIGLLLSLLTVGYIRYRRRR